MNDHRYNLYTKNGHIFFISAKHHGKQTCTYVLRVCIRYLVVSVNRSKLDFPNLNQMWHKILICNEFTFNVAQYLFVMFCFHPASTISTQHPLFFREISIQHPDPFHPASRRKIGLCNLTFRSMLNSSHITVHLQCLSSCQIKTMGSESRVVNWHTVNRHFPCSAMMDAGWNSTQHHCLRVDTQL